LTNVQHEVEWPKVSIDLAKLRAGDGPECEVLRSLLNMIQGLRQDFNGRILTVRTEDLYTIACLFGITPEAMDRRLDELGVRAGALHVVV